MKKIILAAAIAASTLPMTACMGQMGLTQLAMGVNLKLVDNRFGRAGIYILAAPVYGITSFVDLLVINSIEFWTGKNPLTNKSPAVVDTPVESWMKVNDQLPDEAKKPVLKTGSTFIGKEVDKVATYAVDRDTMIMEIHFADGSKDELKALRSANNEEIEFYYHDQLVAAGNTNELEAHIGRL